MSSKLVVQPKSLYDEDFYLWTEKTIQQLETGAFAEIDYEHLIQELNDLGSSNKNALYCYLKQLLLHLLKIQYWHTERESCFRGWDVEVDNFRDQIEQILKNSPSLRNYLVEIFDPVYKKSRRTFLKETGTNSQSIPEQSPFTLEQFRDEDWLPWKPNLTP